MRVEKTVYPTDPPKDFNEYGEWISNETKKRLPLQREVENTYIPPTKTK
jgi:hypothetical protein